MAPACLACVHLRESAASAVNTCVVLPPLMGPWLAAWMLAVLAVVAAQGELLQPVGSGAARVES
eukprot:2888305-Alexandrium_andersonii.AAC.1